MKLFLTILFIIVSIILTILVLAQEGKSAGLTGTITGDGSDTYWSKNKGRSKEGALEKGTKFLALAFMLLAILLQINF